MKRLRGVSALAAAVAVAAVVAAGAAAANSVAFSASYAGKATEQVSGTTVNATATGAGTGNVVGKSTIAGSVVADTSNPPCGPFNGPGSIKGLKGTLKVTILNSRGCAAGQDDQNNISLSGTAKVNGGTGKFKKAKGNLHFSGHYDRASGAFTVKLSGTLTL